MITVSIFDCNEISKKAYEEMLAALQIHQLQCPSCKRHGCMVYHGYYKRSVFTGMELFFLQVCRLKCSCGKTHAILPMWLVPYSKLPLEMQCSVAQWGCSRNAVTQIQLSGIMLDERTIRYIFHKYKTSWEQRIRSIPLSLAEDIPSLVAGCFLHYGRQFMQIKRTTNQLFFIPT